MKLIEASADHIVDRMVADGDATDVILEAASSSRRGCAELFQVDQLESKPQSSWTRSSGRARVNFSLEVNYLCSNILHSLKA